MRTMRVLAILLGAATCMAPLTSAEAQLDRFLCYRAKTAKGTAKFGVVSGVNIVDQFEDAAVDVIKPLRLCAPAKQGADSYLDPDTHLESYRMVLTKTDPKQPKPVRQRNIRVIDEFGEIVVDAKNPVGVLVPTAACIDDPPGVCPEPFPPPDFATHDVDHYQCYAAATSRGAARFPSGIQVALETPFAGPKVFDVKRPKRLCLPADIEQEGIKNPTRGLMCYVAKPAKGEPKLAAVTVAAANRLGTESVDVKKEQMLCVPAVADSGRCNGAAALCDRRFDQVVYPTTHNAYSNEDEGFVFPNQHHTMAEQLADGVRAVMLDTHYFEAQVYLCHNHCPSGKKLLADGLAEIKQFLDRHPNDVVSIIFESYVSAADTAAAFAASGLLPYVHSQAAGELWPTLREMIDAGGRLVVFTDYDAGVYPWYLDVWAFAWETHYSFEMPADFSCAINRGDMNNRLFILNHFLTQIFGLPQLAEQVNFNPLFVDRARQCQSESGRLPNFVTVDFYDIGDLFSVAGTLNETE